MNTSQDVAFSEVGRATTRNIVIAFDEATETHFVRESLEEAGYAVQNCFSGGKLVKPARLHKASCLIVSSTNCDSEGVNWVASVRCKFPTLAIISLVQRGDVPNAVCAIRAGCSDVMEMPLDAPRFLEVVSRAMDDIRLEGNPAVRRPEALRRMSLLTPRQVEVLERVLLGHASKVIALDLSISRRTVENHRATIMDKTGSRSLPALVRLAVVADGFCPPRPAVSWHCAQKAIV